MTYDEHVDCDRQLCEAEDRVIKLQATLEAKHGQVTELAAEVGRLIELLAYAYNLPNNGIGDRDEHIKWLSETEQILNLSQGGDTDGGGKDAPQPPLEKEG